MIATTTNGHSAINHINSFMNSNPTPPVGSAVFEEPVLRSIEDIINMQIDESDTLLGRRFLCRKGGLFIIGQSGVGKSSSGAQMAMNWAIGREAFGIKPAGPLRILVVQAENDDGDIQEMTNGVLIGLQADGASVGIDPELRKTFEGFSEEELKVLPEEQWQLLNKNLRYTTIIGSSGPAFLERLDAILEKCPFDLIWIDPFFSFLGGDPTETSRLMDFLRSNLTPLLHKHNVGVVITHHTPKTNNRDTSNWTTADFSYAGAGGAEITNWARAVIVVSSTQTQGTFEFRAAKRGRRIGWQNEKNEQEYARYYRHNPNSGAIYWVSGDATEVQLDAEKKKNRGRSSSDPEQLILSFVETAGGGGVEKSTLLDQVKKMGASTASASATLKRLLHADKPKICERQEKRKGCRPRLMVIKQPLMSMAEYEATFKPVGSC